MTLSSCPASRSSSTWIIGMRVRRLLVERLPRWPLGWPRNSRRAWGADAGLTGLSPSRSL